MRTATINGHTYTVPSDAVRAVRPLFNDLPREYIIRPPYGDGTTRYPSREAAYEAIGDPEPLKDL